MRQLRIRLTTPASFVASTRPAIRAVILGVAAAVATALLLGAAGLGSAPAHAQLVINEFLSANQYGIADEDGDRIDWIEIYNADTTAVDLTDYGLSDDGADPFRWRFPALALGPAQRVTVFATGKDRVDIANHHETVVDHGSDWRYRLGDSEPPADWRTLGFDDSGWDVGPSGFGYGDGDDATILPPTISFYIRQRFTVDDPTAIGAVYLHVDADDGFVAYINDVEVGRDNVGLPGDHPAYDLPADRESEAGMYQGLAPSRFTIAIDPVQLFQPGLNVIAIQVHNVSLESGDMSMIPFLTVTMVTPPPAPHGAPDVLRSSLPHLHTSFKLSSAGESIILTSATGLPLDLVGTGQMFFDHSRGRYPDGTATWNVYDAPSPDAANPSGYIDFAATPEFGSPPGFYAGGTAVAITHPSPGATVYYTIDGAEPTDQSSVYVVPIPASETTAVRARAYEPGYLPSRIVTGTYLVDETITLPTISLSTDPHNLWDHEYGIYVLGPFAEPFPPYYGANFWQDWERPIHLEYFAADGTPGFEVDAGVKIYGGFSRSFEQKSLRIIARGGYGDGAIVYPLFAENEITEFQQIVLRNAGNDWCDAHLRDAAMQRMLDRTDMDRQAYDPTVVFLNGEYWGIHNLRERQDKYYLESHHGVDPENIDLLETGNHVIEGDDQHYIDMVVFMGANSLYFEQNFQVVQSMMDTDYYADYSIFEIFFNNRDWPHNNTKWWRPRTPDGRWRWLVFDLDFGLGWFDTTFDMMYWSTEGGYGWANFLLNALLENPGWERGFLNRYADHLNTTFLPERLHPILDELATVIEPEMPRHMTRWEKLIGHWYAHVDQAHDFIDQRPAIARGHVMDHFQIPGTFELTLDVSPPGTGSIRLAAVSIDTAWSGTYFLGVPVTLTAEPAPGYAFSGWSDPLLPPEATVEIDATGDYGVTAFFEEGDSVVVVINEINYNSSLAFDPDDWVELHNPGAEPVDLGGWQFKDENDTHVFEFAPQTEIVAGGYLVLVSNGVAFQALFPGVQNVVGDMGFGLSGNGELVRLFDASGLLVDWVIYDDVPPWPIEPDGNGPTLELIASDLDNALAQSWAASTAMYGTPGELNSVSEPVAVAPTGGAPLRFYLDPAFPNPFNPRTHFRFGVPAAGPVRLTIYDTQGRRVRTLIDAPLAPGHYDVAWDGRNDAGGRVASAVYFYDLRAAGESVRRKVVMVK